MHMAPAEPAGILPGHSRGPAYLRIHDPDTGDDLFDVICPACGYDARVSGMDRGPAQ